MTKKCLALMVIGAIFLASPALAKKDKTGVLEKELFTDSLTGYQFLVPYNWKLKTEKEPSLLRATLQKIRLERLPAGGSQGYYDGERYIPTIRVLADTTSLSLERFCELLLAVKGQLPREKDYLMKLELLLQSKLESEQKIKIGGLEGIKYTFQKRYLKEVDDPRRLNLGQVGNVTVEESIFGHIIVFKKESRVFIIQCLGERATFELEQRDYQKLFESWKFIS